MLKRSLPVVLVLLLTACAVPGLGKDARTEFEKGLALFNAGKYKEAVPSLARATDLDPAFAQAHLYLGRAYLNLGLWTEAVPPIRSAFRLEPTETRDEILPIFFDALLSAATSAFNRGDLASSVDFLKEGLDLDPDSTRFRNELASMLAALGRDAVSQGRTDEAVSAFKEVLDISPERFDAYLGLARAYLLQGEYLKALDTAQQALRLDPGNDEAQRLLLKALRGE